MLLLGTLSGSHLVQRTIIIIITMEQRPALTALEGVGFRVGQSLAERLPREAGLFREELDALKFLCKELWGAVFRKQIDNLRTNHQGTYVLQDNHFALLTQMANGHQYLEEAPKVRPQHPPASAGFLAFTCGLVRGALSTLGIESVVTADVALLPALSVCPAGLEVPREWGW
ncbi:trafficking protein particle complex subunit 6A isoform X2 [Ornithorhynchus anatinus]|uniref:trafficking protein particle complex subunit 6A isoform X2 n=1 Tax=Ornithorhynchus anatinus TaxID=9258 RepID=UPI0019D456A5|nr:trafficking protein particle complex subunit 6A isoform X2 [Ornithorhynchus anatinus]